MTERSMRPCPAPGADMGAMKAFATFCQINRPRPAPAAIVGLLPPGREGPAVGRGEQNAECPECGKNCASRVENSAKWHCFYCGASGSTRRRAADAGAACGPSKRAARGKAGRGQRAGAEDLGPVRQHRQQRDGRDLPRGAAAGSAARPRPGDAVARGVSVRSRRQGSLHRVAVQMRED